MLQWRIVGEKCRCINKRMKREYLNASSACSMTDYVFIFYLSRKRFVRSPNISMRRSRRNGHQRRTFSL